MGKYNIGRYVEAQRNAYTIAYAEMMNGKKETHWTWFVFPVPKGVSNTPNGEYYALEDDEECKRFFRNKYLKNNYIEISKVILRQIEQGIIKENMMSETAWKKIKISTGLFLEKCKEEMSKEEAGVLRKLYNLI